MKVKVLSRVRLLATSWTAAYQAPPSMGFSRQEYWSGVPLPSPTLPLQYFIPEQTSSLSQNISIIAIHVHQLNFEFLEDRGYIMYHVHVVSVTVVPNTV